MTDYETRKAERRRKYASKVGRKLITCTACSGTGRYDDTNSPRCAVCDGTGKVFTTTEER